MAKYRISRLWLIFSLLLLFGFVLDVINRTPSSTSLSCTPDAVQNPNTPLPDYVPTSTQGFVAIEGTHFTVNDEQFQAYGVNYYPAQYPWRRFLTETNPETLDFELSLLADTGFNTLRIFLWNDVLFGCRNAIPNHENFARLDNMIQVMSNHGFRLIVTLNDLPDLTAYPLYNDYGYVREQTTFIVNRYHDETAILAWDLRNEGDIDYGSRVLGFGQQQRNDVLRWLESTSVLVRSLDSNHLITAGWMDDAHATARFVDFISFHHWWNGTNLERRIDRVRRYTDSPILLEEFGFSTYDLPPEQQSQQISEIITIAHNENLLGWLVWTAFDFPLERTCLPSPCQSVDSYEHHFGIWYSDYTPKSVIDIIREFVQP